MYNNINNSQAAKTLRAGAHTHKGPRQEIRSRPSALARLHLHMCSSHNPVNLHTMLRLVWHCNAVGVQAGVARLDWKCTADLYGTAEATRDDGLAGMLRLVDRGHQRASGKLVVVGMVAQCRTADPA